MEFIKEKPSSNFVHKITNWHEKERLNLDYHVNVKFWNDSIYEKTWIGMDIDLKRKFTRNFMEFILPPAVLVFVSWVCKKSSILNRISMEIFTFIVTFRLALLYPLMPSLVA